MARKKRKSRKTASTLEFQLKVCQKKLAKLQDDYEELEGEYLQQGEMME